MDLWEVLSHTRARISDHLVIFLGLAVVQFALLLAFFAAGILFDLFFLRQFSPSTVVFWLILPAFPFVCLFLLAWSYAGVVRVSLRIMREQPVSFVSALEVDGAAFQLFFLLLPLLAISLAVGVVLSSWPRASSDFIRVVFLASIFSLSCILSLAPQFMVDRKMWLWQAIWESAQRTLANFVSFALLTFLSIAFLSLLLPFTFGLSLFFALPFAGAATTIAYFQTTRETLASRFPIAFRKSDEATPGPICPPPDFEE